MLSAVLEILASDESRWIRRLVSQVISQCGLRGAGEGGEWNPKLPFKMTLTWDWTLTAISNKGTL